MAMSMQSLSGARVAPNRVVQTARPQTRCNFIVASDKQQTPQNVLEARAWIAAWEAKGRQTIVTQVVAPKAAVPNATHSSASGSKWGTVLPDGTVIFTAGQLTCPDRTKAALSRIKGSVKGKWRVM